jgi:hypothetical protein
MRRWCQPLPLWTVFCVLSAVSALSQIQPAPAPVAATLIVKLAAFEKTLAAGGDLSFHVTGDPGLAAELRKGVGLAVGRSRLARVSAGSGLPQEKPSVLVIGGSAALKEALAFTRSRKVLSATAVPEWVAEGVTLGVGIGNDGKPKVLLNLSSTVDEGLDWNPAILKLAKTIQ